MSAMTIEPKNNWKNIPRENKVNQDVVLLRFFLRIYKEQFGFDYRIARGQDTSTMQKLRKTLKEQNEEISEKEFLAWMVENSHILSNKNRCLVLQDYKEFIVPFINRNQEKTKGISDPTFTSRLRSFCLENSIEDVLARYGIPVTIAVLNKTGQNANSSVGNIKKIISSLYTSDQYDILLKIAKNSVLLSPYPEDFPMIGWRKLFSDIWDSIGARGKPWWREEDYKGHDIPGHYFELLKED